MKELQNRKYKLVDLQYKQGFGCTWNAIANDHGIKTPISIYTVNHDLENDDNYQTFVETLEREAKIIAKSQNSNFPDMTFFNEDGIPYLVIEVIVGTSLKEKLKSNQPMPEQEVIAYFRAIAEGLEELHQQKVSHRNIQPKNIILTNENRAILTGVSLAQQIAPQSSSTEQTHSIYLPPVDATSDLRRGAEDVYALAATMYYAVTAKLPESFLTRLLSGTDTLTPPITHNSRLSLKLNQAILQAMSLKSNSRSVLRNWLDVLPKELNSQTPTEQAPINPERDAIAKRQVPIGWLLWNGTAHILLGILLSVALTTKLIGITWLAAIAIAIISVFMVAKDHSASSWAIWVSVSLLVSIFAVVWSSISSIMIWLIISLIAIAAYLIWRGEWYRVQDIQRAWKKERDRTKAQIAGFAWWQRYGMLIATNLICLLAGRIVWALAHSQGMQG